MLRPRRSSPRSRQSPNANHGIRRRGQQQRLRHAFQHAAQGGHPRIVPRRLRPPHRRIAHVRGQFLELRHGTARRPIVRTVGHERRRTGGAVRSEHERNLHGRRHFGHSDHGHYGPVRTHQMFVAGAGQRGGEGGQGAVFGHDGLCPRRDQGGRDSIAVQGDRGDVGARYSRHDSVFRHVRIRQEGIDAAAGHRSGEEGTALAGGRAHGRRTGGNGVLDGRNSRRCD
mmetsp:Transcript_34454/g.72602  ORF Transcript_34454/g.72602 Transcript_34454/m.72602 type:complete len:227 (+) Transcript_34454:674-1354(+)